MDVCKKCVASITWHRTASHKSMPVNSEETPFVIDRNDKFIAMDPDGNFIRGRPCSESNEDDHWIYARLSHFATCPNAEAFRR